MIGAFKFNGIESSSFSLVCKSVKRPLLPPAKLKRVELPGASGVYDFSAPEYGNREIVMRITYLEDTFENMRSHAREIAAWLSTTTWAKLIINDEPDKYYMAKVIGATDMTALFTAGQADISFDCLPYAYSLDEVVLTPPFDPNLEEYDLYFMNPGTRVINYKSPYGSKSVVKIVGSWTDELEIYVNGETLYYDESGNNTTIYIDSIEMQVKNGYPYGDSIFEHMTGALGRFFSIYPGENNIWIAATALNLTTLEITFIPLWL